MENYGEEPKCKKYIGVKQTTYNNIGKTIGEYVKLIPLKEYYNKIKNPIIIPFFPQPCKLELNKENSNKFYEKAKKDLKTLRSEL